MSKFLLMSSKGDGLGFALWLKAKGHEVKVRILGTKEREHFDGLIEKVDAEGLASPDRNGTEAPIIVFDSTGAGVSADRLRARGHSVFLGSVFADQLEQDRELAFELMQQSGIRVPAFKTFYSWDAGKAYARRHGGQLVFKPTGKASEDEALGSYVSTDPKDLETMLDFYASVAKHSPEYILQDFVEGVCVSTEGWYNGYDWMDAFNHTLECKAMYNDDLGPSTGCAINLVWKPDTTNRVIEEGIKRFEPILREYNYIGPIDLNTVVNEDGVFALEFTPRLGYDAFPSLLELIPEDCDLGEIIAEMARGNQPEELPLKRGYASAVRVSIPPHPSDEFVHPGGVPIQGLTREDRKHLYFFEVRLDNQDRLVSSRGSGAICAVTGYGATIEEAFEEPYKIAKRLRIPEKQYRTDGAVKLSNEHARLYRQLAIGHHEMKFVGGVAG